MDKIPFETVEVNILALAAIVAEKVPEILQPWLAFGSGKNF